MRILVFSCEIIMRIQEASLYVIDVALTYSRDRRQFLKRIE